MKNRFAAITALLCASTIFHSCAVSENAVTVKNEGAATSNQLSKTCFVQLNDGSIKQYHSLKLVTGVLTKPHLVANDKEVINTKDIIAYQDKSHYAVAAKLLTGKRSGAVPTETLPGFAVKILSGKLNLYRRSYYNGANTTAAYFLQEGEEGHIIAYSKEALQIMLGEDKKALHYFNSKTKKAAQSKIIIATVAMYNGNSQLLTKN